MIRTDFAAAVKATVQEWTAGSPQEERERQLDNPAALGTELGLAVQGILAANGHSRDAIRNYVLQAPFRHFEDVFDANELVDTPDRFYPVPETEATLAGRAAALGIQAALQLETISYSSENDGNLFVNLVVLPGEGRSAEKSKKSMRGHTDAASFPFNGEDDPQHPRIAPSPDIVTLVGLRNPLDVPTTVIPVAAVLAHIDAKDIRELRKPQYGIATQESFVEGTRHLLGAPHVAYPVSVLKDSEGAVHVRYSHSKLSALDESAKKASESFEAACPHAAESIVIRPGDVLVINNRLSLHGRAQVGDEVGGQSRWLLRTYGLDALHLAQDKRRGDDYPTYVLYP